MNRILMTFACLAFAAAGSTRAQTAATPSPEYLVTPAQGPWMICAASYTGPVARELAFKLIEELRTQYQLPAYVFNRGDKERQEQQAEIDRRRRQQEEWLRQRGLTPDLPFNPRIVRIEDQYAVLVGGYQTMDAATKALSDLKKRPAPKSVPHDSYLSGPSEADQANGNVRLNRETAINPFHTAFVVRNPTVPRTEDNTLDPFLKDLNSRESLSLLRCKQPWTLVVKVFHGASVIQPQSAPPSLMDKLLGSRVGEQLDAGAVNAHNLAEALRQMKYEAYVLHTRTASLVCVGGFARKDDPAMEHVKLSLCRSKIDTKGQKVDLETSL